jgi:hypothetical protein
MILLVAGAWAANPWKDMPADVVTEVTVAAAPEVVTRLLADLPAVAEAFPSACFTRWSLGVPDRGLGAMARLTYTPHWMSRRLTLEVGDVAEGQRVVWEHPEDGGFQTTFGVSAVDGGSRVTVETPINPLPWPIRKLYQNRIRPAWEACYRDGLQRLTGAK